tara:strand:- start:437 stop:1576 length:1140 start_codon:yes stop_codon:yes gene_type:complete
MSLISGLLNKLSSNIFGGGNVGTPDKAALGAQLRQRSNFQIDSSQFAHTDVNKFSFGSLTYPEVLETDPGLGHYMLFYIYRTKNSKYNPRGTETSFKYDTNLGLQQTTKNTGGVQGIESSTRNDFQADTLKRGKRDSIREDLGFVKTSDAIALYMPPNLEFSYKADYRASETGAAGQFAKQFGVSSIKDTLTRLGTSGGTDFIKETIGEKLLKDVPAQIGEFLGGGDITGVIRLSTQKALNPHLEAIFEKVNMREFSYTFRFTPKNEREVDTVDKIIKLFKFHMMPEKPIDAAIGRYLTMPSEFEIHYMYKGVENTWLPFVSNSVLTNVSLSYGPGGQFQTFRPKATPDGNAPPPTEIEMKLDFMETEAMTKEKIMEGY